MLYNIDQINNLKREKHKENHNRVGGFIQKFHGNLHTI